MSGIGREIKRLREERSWSQAELAVYAGSSQPTVNQIESGKRNPSTRTLEKLAAALDVEVADLFPKGQAPLPLKFGGQGGAPELSNGSNGLYDEEARDWRLLGYVRSWILLLDNLSERWEKAAEHGNFSPEVYTEFGETFENVADAVKSIMEGLKRHQGIDPLEGTIGLKLRESLVRWARAFQAVNRAFIETYGENDLARLRREQAETLRYVEEPSNAQDLQSASAG